MIKSRHVRRWGVAFTVGAALAALTGGILAVAASAPPPPVKTFEKDAEGLSPWYDATLTRVTSPAPHGGNYSLRVRPRDENWGVEEAWPGEFAVSSGKSYRFGLWTRAVSGTTSVEMTVVWLKRGSTDLREDTLAAVPALGGKWTETVRRLAAPKGATSVVFRFAGTGRGSWQLDDLSVRPTSPVTDPPTTTTRPTMTTTTKPAPTTTTRPTTTKPTTTTTAPPPPAVNCTRPEFVTSENDDGWGDGDYYVHNNMWNAGDYRVSQKLAACSYRNWYVTATADDSSGDGAVKTYPNVHKDYHDWGTDEEPPLSAYPKLTSTFAATSPHVGVYNVAYDIWLNGVPGNREIMIWTENYRQTPAGDRVASGLSFSGMTWDLYATDDNEYLAFVPARPMTKGTLDLRAFLDYLIGKRRVPANSTLGQICFGVEIVSTGGKPARFQVTDFSITDR